jgi:hypothetical protein
MTDGGPWDEIWAEGLGGTMVSLVVGTLLCGLVGALIGRWRGRTVQGLGLGLMFGPLGWIWVAALPSRKPPSTKPWSVADLPMRPCPGCGGEIPVAAVRCRHCGARFAEPPS